MSGYVKKEIIKILVGVPDATQREELCSAVQDLVTPDMFGHDVLEIMRALDRVRQGGVNITRRAEDVLTQIGMERQSGLLTEAELFTRIIQLIQGLNITFTQGGVHVNAQEALITERQIIYDAYGKLASDPRTAGLIAKNLITSQSEFQMIMRDVQGIIESALKRHDLSDQERFRLTTALAGVDYVLGIRSTFKPRENLPELRQIFGLLYKTLNPVTLNDQIKSYIALHFSEVQNLFPEDAGIHGTIGLFLESPEGIDFIKLVQEGEGSLKTHLQSKHLQWLKRARTAVNTPMNVINPLVEVLFMSKRGHNQGLFAPEEADNQACADGVYIGAMRALSEVPAFNDIGHDLQTVDVVSCG
jgi:hypothetical protein